MAMSGSATGEGDYTLASLGGWLLAALIVLQVVLVGPPPAPADPANEVSKFLADKSSTIPIAAILHGLALIGAFFFFGGLMRRIAENDRVLATTAGLAAAVGGALVTVGIATEAALSSDALNKLPPDAQQAFWLVGSTTQTFSAFAFAGLTAATALAISRYSGFPSWIGGLSWLSAVLWVVSGLGVMSDADIFPIIGLAAIIVWIVWLGALAMALRTATTATVSTA